MGGRCMARAWAGGALSRLLRASHIRGRGMRSSHTTRPLVLVCKRGFTSRLVGFTGAEASREELKKLFFTFALRNHPDVKKVTEGEAFDAVQANSIFIQARDEYEEALEAWELRRRQGGGGGTAGGRRGGRRGGGWRREAGEEVHLKRRRGGEEGGGDERWGWGGVGGETFVVDMVEEELSPIHRSLLRRSKAGDCAGAVAVWESKGMRSMPLLLFLLKVWRDNGMLPPRPTLVKLVLLLKQEANYMPAGDKGKAAAEEEAVKESGLVIFNGCRTQAFNDLIKVCVSGGSGKEDIFLVLGEMYAANVEKDVETFYQIDRAWQMIRQDYSC